MKTVALIFITLALIVCRAVAEDSTPSPVSIETLISSLPKQFEREWWKSYSEDERKSPGRAKLAEKMKNIPANCRQLQSRLIEGKPLSDYPGLLTLGVIIWLDGPNQYVLKVQSPIRGGEGSYAGFSCTFDQTFNIKRVSPSEWTF